MCLEFGILMVLHEIHENKTFKWSWAVFVTVSVSSNVCGLQTHRKLWAFLSIAENSECRSLISQPLSVNKCLSFVHSKTMSIIPHFFSLVVLFCKMSSQRCCQCMAPIWAYGFSAWGVWILAVLLTWFMVFAVQTEMQKTSIKLYKKAIPHFLSPKPVWRGMFG